MDHFIALLLSIFDFPFDLGLAIGLILHNKMLPVHLFSGIINFVFICGPDMVLCCLPGVRCGAVGWHAGCWDELTVPPA